jgi:hypothetical protein
LDSFVLVDLEHLIVMSALCRIATNAINSIVSLSDNGIGATFVGHALQVAGGSPDKSAKRTT